MAVTITPQKLRSRMKINQFSHDPNATTAQITTPNGGTLKNYVDLKDYKQSVLFGYAATVVGGIVTTLEVVVSEATAFSTVKVIRSLTSLALDGKGENAWIELLLSDVAQANGEDGKNYRYASLRITADTATVEGLVTVIGESIIKEENVTPAINYTTTTTSTTTTTTA